MRFQKGCIEINTIKDVPLLRQVLHCQLVTHEQLWRFMRLGLYEFQRSSFNWRVRRLVQSGLLERRSKLPYTSEWNDLQFNGRVYFGEKAFHLREYGVFDQVFAAAPALRDWKVFKNDDRLVRHLKGQIGDRRR